MTDSNGPRLCLVDAHVHIYNCFSLPSFLDHGYRNFKNQAALGGAADRFTGVLLLTETFRDNWFHKLSATENSANFCSGWRFRHTSEPSSLLATSNDGRMLVIIAGRQIVTRENLEVLALLTESGFEDGAPAVEVLQSVRNAGGIPVIPWGFGKWWGRRGRVLDELLQQARSPELFLGDNGGRPRFLPHPAHFRQAETRGIRVLPGSDPLPFPAEARRPGNAGFTVEIALDEAYPTRDLKRVLGDSALGIASYIHPAALPRFIRNQVRMQLRKRLPQRRLDG